MLNPLRAKSAFIVFFGVVTDLTKHWLREDLNAIGHARWLDELSITPFELPPVVGVRVEPTALAFVRGDIVCHIIPTPRWITNMHGEWTSLVVVEVAISSMIRVAVVHPTSVMKDELPQCVSWLSHRKLAI